MTREHLYLGIDAGATKTHALIANGDGHVVGAGRAGTGNWEAVGLEGAYAALSQALQEALSAAGVPVGRLRAAGYALAGVDFRSDLGRLEPVVERLGVPGPRIVVNDAEGALRAGAPAGWGVAAIGGTGSTVVGRNRRGECFRTFGQGLAFGDVGGAGDIVYSALRAVARAHTGRGRPTALTGFFCAHCGVPDTVTLVESIVRRQVPPPPVSLAPLIFQVAERGDLVAQEVIREVGRELGWNVVAVARRLSMDQEPFDLVLAGGVFRAESHLFLDGVLEPVRQHTPLAQTAVLRTVPVVGGVLLAMECDGVEITRPAYERLAAEGAVSLAGRL